jgi:hypothetical protein
MGYAVGEVPLSTIASVSAGYWVKQLTEIPRVRDEEPGAPEWYPIQHHFGLTAFGANVYVAREAGDALIGDHDETGSGQEELYIVLAGKALFELDGDSAEASAVSVVCVLEPSVRRRAVAASAGTTVLAVGGRPRKRFASTWRPQWFREVPRVS